ncbi:MAG: homeostatic response regulator transcription factor HsrA [Helicobacteraceae bacterium]|jgi:two-component system OmpR family response regulator|nr:homeostatic response regulator transcription factor HsrA [Helicobacteraceae bacterium]
MKRLLILSSSEVRRRILAENLNALRYATTTAQTIEEGEEALNAEQIDVVVSDWRIAEPVIDSFALSLKKNAKQVSLVVVSDNPSKDELIDALNRGADDYCETPFWGDNLDQSLFDLLEARIEARLRFGGTNVIDAGELIIDPDEEKIYYRQREIELKGKPFEVLTHLARNRDQIISKEQLLDAIWEEPELVTPNVIEVAINQIRQKMDKPLGINTIETVRRRGYRFCFPNCSGQTITDK